MFPFSRRALNGPGRFSESVSHLLLFAILYMIMSFISICIVYVILFIRIYYIERMEQNEVITE